VTILPLPYGNILITEVSCKFLHIFSLDSKVIRAVLLTQSSNFALRMNSRTRNSHMAEPVKET